MTDLNLPPLVVLHIEHMRAGDDCEETCAVDAASVEARERIFRERIAELERHQGSYVAARDDAQRQRDSFRSRVEGYERDIRAAIDDLYAGRHSKVLSDLEALGIDDADV